MRRLRLSFTSGSIAPVAVLIAVVQGPVGPAPSAFASCSDARFAPRISVPAGGAVEGIASADLDGDGTLDLAATNFTAGGGASNSVAILLGDGRGTFGAPTRFAVGHGATRVIASDLDADGKTDLAVLNTNDGTVSILLGDGLHPSIHRTGDPVRAVAHGEGP